MFKVALLQFDLSIALNEKGLKSLENTRYKSFNPIQYDEMFNFIEESYDKYGIRKFILYLDTVSTEKIAGFVRNKSKYDSCIFIPVLTNTKDFRINAPNNFYFTQGIILDKILDIVNLVSTVGEITTIVSDTFSMSAGKDISLKAVDYGKIYSDDQIETIDFSNSKAVLLFLDSIEFENVIKQIPVQIPIYSFQNALPSSLYFLAKNRRMYNIYPDSPIKVNYNIKERLSETFHPALPCVLALSKTPDLWDTYIENKTIDTGFTNFGISIDKIRI
jgi:hypothetical protein